MQVIETVDQALKKIDSFEGKPEDFVLRISHSLLDPVGVNMAIITDRILSRNWEPNGFEEGAGFRIYRYKAWA